MPKQALSSNGLGNYPALLNTAEAASYLGYTPKFLEARRVRGDGPAFIRFSTRAVRYRLQDLDAWIAQKLKK